MPLGDRMPTPPLSANRPGPVRAAGTPLSLQPKALHALVASARASASSLCSWMPTAPTPARFIK
eukprot:2241426-Alexandrium_andersonii.AAC.1